MGYAFVTTRLAQGSAPTNSDLRGAFDAVVLCARELQDLPLYGVEVIHAPLDDDRPSRAEVQIAWNAAKRVARRIRAGRRVLVTCAMGWNRSGLVTGLALIMLGLSADQAVHAIRKARGDMALSNPHFVKVLHAVRAMDRPAPAESAAE